MKTRTRWKKLNGKDQWVAITVFPCGIKIQLPADIQDNLVSEDND